MAQEEVMGKAVRSLEEALVEGMVEGMEVEEDMEVEVEVDTVMIGVEDMVDMEEGEEGGEDDMMTVVGVDMEAGGVEGVEDMVMGIVVEVMEVMGGEVVAMVGVVGVQGVDNLTEVGRVGEVEGGGRTTVSLGTSLESTVPRRIRLIVLSTIRLGRAGTGTGAVGSTTCLLSLKPSSSSTSGPTTPARRTLTLPSRRPMRTCTGRTRSSLTSMRIYSLRLRSLAS